MMMVSPLIDPYLIESLFFWLPTWFFIGDFVNNLGQSSQSALLLTAVLGLVLKGLVGPILEQLYFRGYLLPGISRLGSRALH